MGASLISDSPLLAQELIMIGQSIILKLSSSDLAESKTSRLRQEYQAYVELFQVQPDTVQQFLTHQAAALAEAVLHDATQASFTLPNQVIYPRTLEGVVAERPSVAIREQKIGSFLNRLTHTRLHNALCQRLTELETSPDPAISISAGLLRYAVSEYMIYHLLPSGQSVVYADPGDDDIPNRPVDHQSGPAYESIMHTGLQSIKTQHEGKSPDVESPYVKAALDFFLPQWVAIDHQGNLLVNSVQEAEAHIASMQHFLAILDFAIIIAPYMIVNEIYLQKRYGILGQLVNQGRALARYESQAMVKTIQKRASEHKLDRGVELRVPYFDDRKFTMESYDFMIIPAGWIMFIPAFAVLASREQQFKVAQDQTLSFATRKHLLAELHDLELAFMR
jgi:hypothetical protein